MRLPVPCGATWRSSVLLGLAALGLGACSDQSPVDPAGPVIPEVGFNTARLELGEQLYLSDSKDNGDDVSEIFAVDLDEGPGQANLTSIIEIPFDQVDALAASPDGNLLYAVNKDDAKLGIVDLTNGTFDDRGSIDGVDGGDQIVLAATDPAGNLLIAGQAGGDRFYRVTNLISGTPTATNLGSANLGSAGLNLLGADMAYSSTGTLFVYTNGGGLYTVDFGDEGNTGDNTATPVTTSGLPGGITGLAIRGYGNGDLVFSAGDGASGAGLDSYVLTLPQDGSGTPMEYRMTLNGVDYDYTFGDMTIGALDLGCTSTQGYWGSPKGKDRWIPDTGIDPDAPFLGEYFTDKKGEVKSWYEVLRMPPKGGDADVILAHQFIAAYLNQQSGTYVPSDVQEALDRAELLFTGSDPYASREEKIADADLLASYNEGNEGVPSCDTALTEWMCPAVVAVGANADGVTQIDLLEQPLADVRPSSDPDGPLNAQVFAEYAGFDHGGIPFDITAGNTVVLDGSAGVANGIPMCSYYVNYDNGDLGGNGTENDPATRIAGSLTFESEIEGLIVAGTINTNDIFWKNGKINTMCDTDAVLGSPGTTYSDPATCGVNGDARGLEIFSTDPSLASNQDPIFVSTDRKTVEFSLQISNKHDSFRVIVNPVARN